MMTWRRTSAGFQPPVASIISLHTALTNSTRLNLILTGPIQLVGLTGPARTLCMSVNAASAAQVIRCLASRTRFQCAPISTHSIKGGSLSRGNGETTGCALRPAGTCSASSHLTPMTCQHSPGKVLQSPAQPLTAAIRNEAGVLQTVYLLRQAHRLLRRLVAWAQAQKDSRCRKQLVSQVQPYEMCLKRPNTKPQ